MFQYKDKVQLVPNSHADFSFYGQETFTVIQREVFTMPLVTCYLYTIQNQEGITLLVENEQIRLIRG